MDVTVLVVPESDADDEEADRLARRLRAELAELDTESVRLATGGEVPAGAKAADATTVGAIVVALGSSGAVFPAVIETVRDWLGRQHGRHRVAVTIDGDSIELEAATVAQQRAIVDAFVRKHAVQ
jgi:hypothetical protein